MSRLRGYVVWPLVLVLAACGGGGGGSTSTDPGPSGSATGLIPTAPALGAQLASDATSLRPLRDGSKWHYRGTRYTATGAVSAFYANQVRLVARGAGSFSESNVTTDSESSSSQRTVSVSGGAVNVSDEAVDLTTLILGYAELRSPVRVNDQITLVDRLAVELTVDLDRDGRKDAVDMAGYSRVVGEETVDLPELGRSVRAIRVDGTLVLRYQLSSRTTPEPLVYVSGSTWYAPGVGVVRELSRQAVTSGEGQVETDERLQYFHGGTAGLGLRPFEGVAKVGASPTDGPWYLGSTVSAAAGVDRAYVLSSASTFSYDARDGFRLLVIDPNGVALAETPVELAGVDVNARPQLLPLGAQGVAMVVPESTPRIEFQPESEVLRLHSINPQGLLGSNRPVLVSRAISRTAASAADGGTVFVAWGEGTVGSGPASLKVRAFNAQGSPLGPAQTLDSSLTAGDAWNVSLAANAGKAVVTWRRTSFVGETHRYAVVTADTSSPARDLITNASSFGGGYKGQVTPLLANGVAVLTWMTPLNQLEYPLGLGLLRGVRLDANSEAIRTSGVAVDAEFLRVGDGVDPEAVRLADGAALHAAGWGRGVLRPADVTEDPSLDWWTLGVGSGPLAAGSPVLHRYRASTSFFQPGPSVPGVGAVVTLPDRWLIVGASHPSVAVLFK